MKATFIKCGLGLLLAPLIFNLQSLRAQDNPPPKEHGDHMGFLTPEERAQLKKAHEAVLASNADLKKQAEDLRAEGKALHENASATEEDKKAFREKRRAFEQTVRQAMLAQDPSLKPIFEKIEANRKEGKEGHEQQ